MTQCPEGMGDFPRQESRQRRQSLGVEWAAGPRRGSLRLSWQLPINIPSAGGWLSWARSRGLEPQDAASVLELTLRKLWDLR